MEEPRPYVVLYLVGSDRREDRVTAYNLMEAAQQVLCRVAAKGETVYKLLDVFPDEESIARKAEIQREAMSGKVALAVSDALKIIGKGGQR